MDLTVCKSSWSDMLQVHILFANHGEMLSQRYQECVLFRNSSECWIKLLVWESYKSELVRDVKDRLETHVFRRSTVNASNYRTFEESKSLGLGYIWKRMNEFWNLWTMSFELRPRSNWKIQTSISRCSRCFVVFKTHKYRRVFDFSSPTFPMA